MRSFGLNRTILALVLLVGLGLRLGYGLAVGLNTPPKPGSDQREYEIAALNLLAGEGYRGISWGNPQEHLTAYRPPMLSASWALLFGAFGHRYDVLRLAD